MLALPHRRSTSVLCALIAGLAMVALAAPAGARLIDEAQTVAGAPVNAGGTDVAAADQQAPRAVANARGTDVAADQQARVEAATSSLAGTTSSPSQDLRAPDTRDATLDRGTFNAPDVTVVKLAQPAPAHVNAGVDWRDAGIGAGMLGMVVLGLAGATAILHRRRRVPRAATAA